MGRLAHERHCKLCVPARIALPLLAFESKDHGLPLGVKGAHVKMRESDGIKRLLLAFRLNQGFAVRFLYLRVFFGNDSEVIREKFAFFLLLSLANVEFRSVL